MNKNYNKKKYAVITALSILAVCLAVMLIRSEEHTSELQSQR